MKRSIIAIVAVAVLSIGAAGCLPTDTTPKSASGVTQAKAKVNFLFTGGGGLFEQRLHRA